VCDPEGETVVSVLHLLSQTLFCFSIMYHTVCLCVYMPICGNPGRIDNLKLQLLNSGLSSVTMVGCSEF